MAETAQNITKNIYLLKGKIKIGDNEEFVIAGNENATDLTTAILSLFEEKKSFIKSVDYTNQIITITWNGIDDEADSTTTIDLNEFFNEQEIELYIQDTSKNLKNSLKCENNNGIVRVYWEGE